MKTNIITLIVLFMVITCHATQVPIKKARIIARNFYLERINIHDHRDQVDITGEFTIGTAGQPVYYVFNMDNEGFIIIAALEESYPVLGYSFEGTYKGNSRNAAFNYWMDNYSNQLAAIRENADQADAKIKEAWEEYSKENYTLTRKEILDVEPLLHYRWGQDYPFNTYCPYDLQSSDTNFIVLDTLSANLHNHTPSGCLATAMGMIMAYWRYPLTGTGTHCDTLSVYGDLCVNYENATYDWSAMTERPLVENDPVAMLLYHCGVGINMMYEYNSSYGLFGFLPEAYITHFNYDIQCVHSNRNPSYSFWISLLKSDLNNGWPIQFDGQGSGGGHSFVCDGYQGNDFFHFNWGWEGVYDGYYYLDNLNPHNLTFNNNQGAVLHIHPPVDQYPYDCEGNTELLTAKGSIEDGSGPVLNYLNDADCGWLIAPDDSVASVTLRFVKFQLHTSDTLKVYDGEDAGAPLLGWFTGTALPEAVTSTAGKMFVRFITDDTLAANGFLAEYSSVEYPFCNDTVVYSDEVGVIGDGSGRFKYRNGTTCVTKIYNERADQVSLKFTQFNTESNRDTVNIYDITGNTLIARYSGSYMTPPDTLKVIGQGILVVFKSDSLFRKAGWTATYNMVFDGINDYETSNFKVYPNPAHGYCMIETSSTGQLDAEMTVYTTQGNAIHRQILDKPTNYLTLGNFRPGIYILMIKTSTEVTGRKLVVY